MLGKIFAGIIFAVFAVISLIIVVDSIIKKEYEEMWKYMGYMTVYLILAIAMIGF